MRTLKLSAQGATDALGQLDFEAYGDDQRLDAVQGQPRTFQLKSGTRVVRVKATQTRPFDWTAEGKFDVLDPGALVPQRDCPAEFDAVPLGRDPGPDGAAAQIVVSRVRDVTDRVLAQLREQIPTLLALVDTPEKEAEAKALDQRRAGKPDAITPAQHHQANAYGAKEFMPWTDGAGPTDWSLPEQSDRFVIDDPPVVRGKVAASKQTIKPETIDRVFYVAGVETPQLVAVSWPDAAPKDGDKRKVPFLVYFRPTTGQNYRNGRDYDPSITVGKYPFGFDYLFWGLWQYLHYSRDALTNNPGWKGLPYQRAAAGKEPVLVLPLPRNTKHDPDASIKRLPEFGEALKATWLEELLRELAAYRFRARARSDGRTPGVALVGRVGLAAFSSGNDELLDFVNAARNRAFLRAKVAELYAFDPPIKQRAPLVDAMASWARGDKRARLFLRMLPNNASKLRGANRTYVVSGDTAWKRLATEKQPAWASLWSWQHTHQIIASMMLTHALRKSGY
jgi:hypothetical protein